MNPRHEIVERKLAALAAYVEELRPKTRLSLVSYRRSGTTRRAVERLLQLCADAAGDACAGLLAAAGRTPAPSLRQQFAEAAALGAIPPELAEQLLRFAGLRNRLVHDYEQLDQERVWSAARDALQHLPRFVGAVSDHLARQEER